MKRTELIRRAPMKRTMPKPKFADSDMRPQAIASRIAEKTRKMPKPVRGTDWPSSKGLKPEVAPRRMKTKQRAVTSAEKVIWSKLAALGCIACQKDGVLNPWVSIHHVSGRTAPGCHRLVLALCAGHHQDGTGLDPGMVAVHPWKARFERLYGDQRALVAECMKLIGETA